MSGFKKTTDMQKTRKITVQKEKTNIISKLRCDTNFGIIGQRI